MTIVQGPIANWHKKPIQNVSMKDPAFTNI